jgi:hypothetical protein
VGTDAFVPPTKGAKIISTLFAAFGRDGKTPDIFGNVPIEFFFFSETLNPRQIPMNYL